MKITFCGGAGSVTGANYLLEDGDDKILIDCGLNQGGTYCSEKNFEAFPYDPASIKAVFVTHAHIDHTGLLPRLYKEGFSGPTYSTPPTQDFAKELLADSEDILSREAERSDKPHLYSIADVKKMFSHWKTAGYDEAVHESGFEVVFRNAGHILGSASIIVKRNGRTIVFSGDIGNDDPPIIKRKELITDEVDYCIMESTYGDRLHDRSKRREDVIEDVIEETVSKKGVLMIPSFAMERAQELLYTINELVENNRIPPVPIYIDSPLAIRLTAVYKWYEEYFSEDAWKLVPNDAAIFSFPGLYMAFTPEESRQINDAPAPKIIIAGSGMSQGGRILHHEKRYLPDPRNTILFVGYQGEGSLGRAILEGAKTVRIFNEEIPVRAKVTSIDSYSAHADQKGLMQWVYPMRTTLKKVFVVQGDAKASATFAGKLRDEYALDTVVPQDNETFELI